MASGVISWSQTASSNDTADANVNWQEGMAPSAVNDSGRAMMASVAKYRDDNAGSLTTAGSSTAYTLTTNQVFASLSAMSGQVVVFQAHTTSGATPTLNVDSLGAKALKGVSGTALATGALLEGGIYAVTYSNADNEFVVHGAIGAVSVGTGAFSGNVTMGGTLTLTGNFWINTNKFIVDASNGNTTVAGTLSVASDLAVNTNKFTVTASSGNTSIAGTLSATGDFAVNSNKFNVTASSGNTAVAGTLAVTGATTLTGALSANNSGGITGRNTVKAFGKVVDQTLQSGSFNVASITDNGSNHSVAFTNAMANGNYAILLSQDRGNSSSTEIILTYSSPNTGGFIVNGWIAGTGNVDPDSYSFMVLSNE